jgi:hypothetical protein
MMRDGSAYLLAAVLLPISIAGGAPSRPSEAELAAITARGILLAEYDTAARQASDAVMALHPPRGALSRYIARNTAGGWHVAFGRLNAANDRFLVAYEAAQTANPERLEVRRYEPPRQDVGFNLVAARGIETALKDFRGADHPYNIAVLPTKGGFFVYVYPAQVKAGVYPLGADVRYRVSPDGMKIIEKRQMHETLIESVSARIGVTVAAGYHTHVLSDLPEDTDVLLVLTRKPRVPEIVVAGACTFTIHVNGKITVADRPR